MDRASILHRDVEIELAAILHLLQLLLLFRGEGGWIFLDDSLNGNINGVAVDLTIVYTCIEHSTYYRSKDAQTRPVDPQCTNDLWTGQRGLQTEGDIINR